MREPPVGLSRNDYPVIDEIRQAISRLKERGVAFITAEVVVDEVLGKFGDPMERRMMLGWASLEVARTPADDED